MAALVTALMAAFIPGASPPDVSTPMVFILDISFMFSEFISDIVQSYQISG
jgi:hypothetical protein